MLTFLQKWNTMLYDLSGRNCQGSAMYISIKKNEKGCGQLWQEENLQNLQ